MRTSNNPNRAARSGGRDLPSHRFSIGQSVVLREDTSQQISLADIYHVTGTLPPQDDSPQYRIRNDQEKHERVAKESTLQPLSTLRDHETANLAAAPLAPRSSGSRARWS